MRTVLVASSKGGAGKTTLATNLAAYFALEVTGAVIWVLTAVADVFVCRARMKG